MPLWRTLGAYMTRRLPTPGDRESDRKTSGAASCSDCTIQPASVGMIEMG